MIFDYRGYGRSEGAPDEEGILLDARAARRWLAARANTTEEQIVVMGRSLGGAVAVDLAARDGARGLILESTFTSLPDVAVDHYPFVPAGLVMRNRFDSLSTIARYHGPIVQSHGTADRTVPFHLGRQLFEAANEPKLFFEIEGGDHNDPQPRAWYDALSRFVESLP
jgi:fermentation-respiration switch protein FrsA (DUF1100 family)